MCTEEPAAQGSKDHSTMEKALFGSLCTNDTSLPGMEIVSRSPGRSTIPLPSVSTIRVPFLCAPRQHSAMRRGFERSASRGGRDYSDERADRELDAPRFVLFRKMAY